MESGTEIRSAAATALPKGISRGAKLWTIRELARRAGVRREDLGRWTVDFGTDRTVIWLDPARKKQIVLAADDAEVLRTPISDLVTNTASWMSRPAAGLATAVPTFVVPFCSARRDGMWLCRISDSDTVICDLDIITSAFFSLARVEEAVPAERDQHDRFPAGSSVSVRDGFLERPIIDEYGLALGQAIDFLLPNSLIKASDFAVKLSHDIDDLDILFSGMPLHAGGDFHSIVRTGWMALPASIRTAIQETTRHKHTLSTTARAIGQTFAGRRPSALQLVRDLATLSKRFGLDSAFYWKASRLTPWDSGYDPCAKKVLALIRDLADSGFENGLHPGYYSYCDPAELTREADRVRRATNNPHLGGRQHYLRWRPRTWKDWEQAGLAYDSSLTYAELCGFRAGTCMPYRPWLIDDDREARLLEIPLIVMDGTLLDYMGESRPEVLADIVHRLMARCRLVGGVFTFLCHNATLFDVAFRQFYKTMLPTFSGHSAFDWRSAMADSWPTPVALTRG